MPAIQAPPSASVRYPRLDIRAPFALGASVVILFFGFFLGTAAYAPIDKGVGLPGTIIVETKVKQVAHLKGGVVAKVLASEGQHVNAGDVLLTLDTSALNDHIAGLETQVAAARRQLDLARQELATIADLQARQLAAKSKVLALDRLVAEVEKDVANLTTRLSVARTERAQSEIRSPVAGRVMSLQSHAAGAVIQPGATVADIVPENDRLVIEGRLAPNQIENVKPGMPAKVWLTALSWRNQRPLAARLAWVSADSVEDRRTGTPYFVARIEIDETDIETAKRMTLHPGMRAEVLLLTGQRTLLDQLIDPMMRNINRAFHS